MPPLQAIPQTPACLIRPGPGMPGPYNTTNKNRSITTHGDAPVLFYIVWLAAVTPGYRSTA